MSGTLRIRDSATWMPQGWVFDNVLSAISRELQQRRPELAEALDRAQIEAGGYGDLRGLDGATLAALHDAALKVWDREFAQAPGQFLSGSAFIAFLWNLSEFRALLGTDSRLHRPVESGRIVFAHGDWLAPSPYFTFVVEGLAADLRLVEPEAATFIADSRKSLDCRLGLIAPRAYRQLTSAFDHLRTYYADGKGRHGHDDSFYPSLGKAVARFLACIDRDSDGPALSG